MLGYLANNNKLKSLQIFLDRRQTPLNQPPSLQMLLLRHSADPFRRKNGQHAHIFNKVKRTDPKDQAELLEADEGSLGEFILDVGDVLFEFLGRVVVANGFLVNVTSASVIIHQSNSVIENGSNFLYLAALSAQHLYSSIHYDLRFLIGIEEGVEMVNDI